MQFIQHRVNKISDLENMNVKYGAEIDLRTDVNSTSSIHLSHDPWNKGDSLTKWLEVYKKRNTQGTIIFNTKEDNLEETVLKLCSDFEIKNFFFLDTALPTFIRFANSEYSHLFSCRLSKFESKEFIDQFKDKITWVWADCFNGIALPETLLKEISKNFKICLVSPELQKQPLEAIESFKSMKSVVNSICTKRPDLWGN